MVHAVDARNVCKKFGTVDTTYRARHLIPDSNEYTPAVVAVDRVSFQVEEGEIFGVVGIRGSGKSTLLRLIATLLVPNQGEIRVFGYDTAQQSTEVQKRINRVSVGAGFFKQLSPIENLLFGARYHCEDHRTNRFQAEETLLQLGLSRGEIDKPLMNGSCDIQRKVAIARALLSRPRLLLMDEPVEGLDFQAKWEVLKVIHELNRGSGTTILFATQDMQEAENLCDRIMILDGGKVKALDTAQGLTQIISPYAYERTLEDVLEEQTGNILSIAETG